MRRVVIVFVVFTIWCGCTSIPKNFTYFYDDVYTGLDTLINIDGYYVSEHACDTSFHSMFMFYPNGVFTIVTTSELYPELEKCFTNNEQSTICKNLLWGSYRVVDDTIKTQTIRSEGGGCVIFRDYMILEDKQLVNISDYVEPQYTRMGYMKNYPSFISNGCAIPSKFYSLYNKRSIHSRIY